jgi:ectoine hydroxylase-related dioxygenase (phytanoyl-CoA dioxygenase family)
MDIPRHGPDADLPSVVAGLRSHGAVIVERRFHGRVLDTLRSDLAGWVERMPAGSQTGSADEREFHGERTTRFGGLAAKSPAFVDVLLDPVLLGAAETLLLPACGEIQCAGTQVMAVGPGEPTQSLHRDQGAWSWFDRRTDQPEVAVSAMVAITDFTAGNGATRVVPGSHCTRTDDPVAYDEHRATPAEMPAGSVLLFTGRAVHGAGANHSDRTRIGMHVFYALGWLRPEEAHQLALTDADARRLPERARRLLGFGDYDPRDGGGRLWTVDYEDPAVRYR